MESFPSPKSTWIRWMCILISSIVAFLLVFPFLIPKQIVEKLLSYQIDGRVTFEHVTLSPFAPQKFEKMHFQGKALEGDVELITIPYSIYTFLLFPGETFVEVKEARVKWLSSLEQPERRKKLPTLPRIVFSNSSLQIDEALISQLHGEVKTNARLFSGAFQGELHHKEKKGSFAITLRCSSLDPLPLNFEDWMGKKEPIEGSFEGKMEQLPLEGIPQLAKWIGTDLSGNFTADFHPWLQGDFLLKSTKVHVELFCDGTLPKEKWIPRNSFLSYEITPDLFTIPVEKSTTFKLNILSFNDWKGGLSAPLVFQTPDQRNLSIRSCNLEKQGNRFGLQADFGQPEKSGHLQIETSSGENWDLSARDFSLLWIQLFTQKRIFPSTTPFIDTNAQLHLFNTHQGMGFRALASSSPFALKSSTLQGTGKLEELRIEKEGNQPYWGNFFVSFTDLKSDRMTTLARTAEMKGNFRGTTQEFHLPSCTLTTPQMQISSSFDSGANQEFQLLLDGKNLPILLLEAPLASYIGETADLSLQVKGKETADTQLSLTTPLLTVRMAGILSKDGFRLTPNREKAQLTYHLDKLPLFQALPLKVSSSSPLMIECNTLFYPFSGDFQQMEVVAFLEGEKLTLKNQLNQTSDEILSYKCTIDKRPLSPTLIDAQLDKSTLHWSIAPEEKTFELSLQARSLPLLNLYNLGKILEGDLILKSKNGEGNGMWNFHSTNMSLEGEGSVHQGMLSLTKPTTLTARNVETGKSALERGVPVILEIAPEGVQIPLAPFQFAKCTIPKVFCSPFQFTTTIQGNGKALFDALRFRYKKETFGYAVPTCSLNRQLSSNQKPATLSVNDKHLYLSRVDLLIENRIWLVLWGWTNLETQKTTLFVGITGLTLSDFLGIQNVSPTFVLPIQIDGTLFDLKLSNQQVLKALTFLTSKLYAQTLNPSLNLDALFEEGVPPLRCPPPWF